MSAGKTIKMLREKHGLTQGQLAIKSYISQGRISIYETGKTEPSVQVFEKILNALGYELVIRRKTE
jgi:transcriptional regulator with XRE-family HTH domain